jgi:hypothetical protein
MCKAILKSGPNEGKVCPNPGKFAGYCGRHVNCSKETGRSYVAPVSQPIPWSEKARLYDACKEVVEEDGQCCGTTVSGTRCRVTIGPGQSAGVLYDKNGDRHIVCRHHANAMIETGLMPLADYKRRVARSEKARLNSSIARLRSTLWNECKEVVEEGGQCCGISSSGTRCRFTIHPGQSTGVLYDNNGNRHIVCWHHANAMIETGLMSHAMYKESKTGSQEEPALLIPEDMVKEEPALLIPEDLVQEEPALLIPEDLNDIPL